LIHGTITSCGISNTFSIQLPEDDVFMCNLLVDDPIVIVIEGYEEVSLCQGYVRTIGYHNFQIEAQAENLESMSERRKHKRYPASLYASIVGNNHTPVLINNISLNGLSILTSSKLVIGETLILMTTISGNSFKMHAKIIWERKLTSTTEYGLSLSKDTVRITELIHMVVGLLDPGC
jgi:PilZ domain